MGLRGVEPLTSRLSGVRSNQLSYRPLPRARQTSDSARTGSTDRRNQSVTETTAIAGAVLNSAKVRNAPLQRDPIAYIMMMSAGILGGTTFADTTVGELAPTLPPDSLLPFSAPESVVVLVLTPLVILVLALIFGVVL